MTHSVGGAGSPSNKIWPGPRPTSVYTKWHFDPSSCLATIDVGRKVGAVPVFRGARSPSNNIVWAEAFLRTKWYLDPSSCLATTARHWPKLGAVPLWRRAGSPSNTMSPRPTSTSLPSGILIDSAVWPQQTGAENWVAAVPLLGGAGPHVTQCGLGRGLPHTNYHLDPCCHLTTTPGPKLGCCVPFFWGGSGIPI